MTDTLLINRFIHKNSAGGTTLPVQVAHPVRALVTRSWYDPELGVRYVGKSADADLSNYLSTNAHPDYQLVYFGQSDVVVEHTGRSKPTLVQTSAEIPF